MTEISLLIHPTVVGSKAYNIFGNLNSPLNLKLRKNQGLGKGFVWLVDDPI